VLKGIIKIIPAAWQYPEITCGRIIFGSREYKTKNFMATKWKQSTDIILNKKKLGTVEVCYLKKMPDACEGPFLKEERNLLNGITKNIEEFIERNEAGNSLRESEYRFARLSQSSKEGLVFHSGGTIIDANKAAAGMLEVEISDLTGRSVYDFMPAESKKIAKKMVASGHEKLYEIKLKKSGGKVIDIEAIGKAIYLKGRKVRATVFRDITEKKIVKENLKESYKKIQKTLEDIIDVLASMVEIRDPYTAGHQKRVTALVTAISEELGLDKDRIKAVSTAAKIHDIGKIGIPISILTKPGKLSDAEYDMIKTHSRIGYDMVKKIKFPWPIADIILQHHERLDGSGYPRGLKGKDICLKARILAVADVVEAMSSHRPYRPSLGIDEALKEIARGKGKLYDSKVVEACIKLFKEKNLVFT